MAEYKVSLESGKNKDAKAQEAVIYKVFLGFIKLGMSPLAHF